MSFTDSNGREIILKNADQPLAVLGNVSYYRDTGQSSSIQDIDRATFVELDSQKIPSFGYDPATHWFKIDLSNQTDQETWFLKVLYPLLDYLEFYSWHGSQWISETTGDQFAQSTRRISDPNFVLPFTLKKGSTRSFYLKVKSRSSIQLPLIICSPQQFEKGNGKDQFSNGLFYGIMLVMVFYNLFLFISLRDINFLYYLLALLAGTSLIAFFQGYGFFYLYPENPQWNYFFSVMGGPLFILTSSQLTRSFLNLKSFSFKLDRLLLATMLATILITSVHFLVPDLLSFGSLHMLMVFNCSLILVSASYCFLNHYRPARYFLLAWVALLVVAVFFSLRNLGIIPSLWISSSSLYVAGIMQTLFISFALGDRINLLTKENEEAKEKELLMEQKAKEKLEAEVIMRIQEITGKNKQLQEFHNVKDKLFSVVSHDLKGPLNTLKGTLNVLHSGMISPDEFKDLVKKIDGQLSETTYLLENLLQWGRTQLEGETFAPKKIELGQLIAGSYKLLERDFEAKQIKFENQVVSPCYAFADENMIITVIRNLFSNAIKFTHYGGHIKCKCYREGGEIAISIIDNGIGVPAHHLDNLFTLHGVTTRGTSEEKGTGIGLVLCREFITRNQGHIWCESKEGSGSTFTFSLLMAI
jgi:signal transduction histidine kinase